MKVFILGAGMSGLATAEKLLERGIEQVTLIEQSSDPGGVSKSFDWGGFKYNDLGPHIWHTPDLNLAKEWESRFEELLVKGKFWGKNVVGDAPGKYVDYPLSHETILGFEQELKVKILEELKECTKENQIKALNFNEYVTALVGPTLTELFFKDYPEKLWGVDTKEMTSNWAPKRISFTETPEQFHGRQWSAIGRYGSGGVINSIFSHIKSMGGRFLFNSTVTGIKFTNNLITGIQVNNSHIINIGKEDRIVSTIPFNYFAKLLKIDNSLVYRGALLVYCSILKETVIPGDAAFLYFAQKDVPFHRLSEQKKFSNLEWPVERSTLIAEVAFNETDLSAINTEAIVTDTIASLIRYGLIHEQELLETKTIKLPHVYPLLTAQKEIEFKSVFSKIQNFDQVYLIGTGGEYHYADLQILYLKGRDLADRIISEKYTKTSSEIKFKSNQALTHNFFPQTPFVIAEIGLNHGGSVEIAKELMIRAKDAGVNFVKFQTYKSEYRVSKVYRSNNYFEELIDTEENLFQMFKKFEFGKDEWKIIFEFAKKIKVNAFSAVFDSESLELLEDLNCPAYKIASMDLNNYPLIELIAKTGKPIILSTGMSSLGEIERAVKIIERHTPTEFIILHCISSYPALKESLNLNAIKTLASAFGRPVGFSDHTIGIEAPIVAVSVGAICIEKHFTLDHNFEGPDHIFSLNPTEMKSLIDIIKIIPSMLGNSYQIQTAQEIETSYKFKKSIHAKRDLKKGEFLKQSDFIIKGPFGGIPPEYLDIIIGRELRKDINMDFPITWDSL